MNDQRSHPKHLRFVPGEHKRMIFVTATLPLLWATLAVVVVAAILIATVVYLL